MNCDKIGSWLFENAEVKNRLWECDKLSKRGLLVLRLIAFLMLIEINVLAMVTYIKESPLKIFSITSVSFLFSFVTYLLILLQYLLATKYPDSCLWKIAHCMFEVCFSFAVGLTIVFWCVVIPVLVSRSDPKAKGLENTWLEIAIRLQLHTVVFGIYLFDLYTNRIEFPFRHSVIVLCCCIIFITVYLLISKFDKPIEDYVNWSERESIGFAGAAGALIMGAFCCAALVSEKKKARYIVQARDGEKGKKEGSERISLDSI